MTQTVEEYAAGYGKRHRYAFWNGHKAGLAGVSPIECPYTDHRTFRGSVTFARAFLKAWHAGWRYGDEEREKSSQ